jgi:hypothetical protein
VAAEPDKTNLPFRVTERGLVRLQTAGLIACVVRHRKGHINRAILVVRPGEEPLRLTVYLGTRYSFLDHEEMLRVELEALREDDFHLDLPGFEDAEIEALLAQPETESAGLTEEDAVPETPEAAVTVPGDVWVLGDHRLLFGCYWVLRR